MLTQTKIAICVAIALGSAVPATTNAFAGNVYDSPDWAPPLYGWDVHRPPAVVTDEGNAHGTAAETRSEHGASRQPNAPRSGY
jgi:hypothetical protein